MARTYRKQPTKQFRTVQNESHRKALMAAVEELKEEGFNIPPRMIDQIHNLPCSYDDVHNSAWQQIPNKLLK